MSMVEELIERNFSREGGELRVGGVSLREIVAEHGTPLFLYDRDGIVRALDRLRRALPERFEVYYSIKANPNQAILRLLVSQGCGLEVASGGELHQALASGCAPERILFAGPGKSPDELEMAAGHGIGEIHVESMEEIDALGSIAERRGHSVGVAIRVNPGGEALGGAMRMGGKPAAFGIDAERLDEAVDRVASRAGLDLRGVHLFAGTQILDAGVLERQYREACAIARRVAGRTGAPLRTVDFGGGLGIPYYVGEQPLDMLALGELLGVLFEEECATPELASARFVVEPGRYLVGESGIYVARVLYVKRSRDKEFVILDGGMHHHLAASGNLGQVIKRNFPVAVLNRLDESPGLKADLAGPLCTPLDVLARQASLPRVEVGDLIGVFQSGAYARAASPLGFLSHASPAEVLVHDGTTRLIRRRGAYEDYLRDQPPANGD